MLQAAVPVALKLIAPPPPAPAPAPVGLQANLGQTLGPSPAAAEQGGSESARQAALELLVDLIDAVDPSLDFTGLTGGAPLAPFVPQLHAALLECLTAPAPGPARLAVRGLASLATRSPSELLAPKQADALVPLFTARLRAEERTVGDAYDPDLARALLQGLQTLSRRRAEHTGAVLAHTLPELLGWMDEAAAAGGCVTPSSAAAQRRLGLLQLQQCADASSHGSSGGGGPGASNSSLELDRCLRALAVLAEQAEVFQAVVPALLTRVLLPASASTRQASATPQLRPGDGTGHILLSVAQIFASTSAANATAVPALLALTAPLASPRAGGASGGGARPRGFNDADDDDEERRAAQEGMEVEGEGGVARRVGDGGAPAPTRYRDPACLWSLVVAVLAAAARGERLGDAALEATLRIVAAATIALPPRLQEAFARRLLRLFLPAAFDDAAGDEMGAVEGGVPLQLLPPPEPRAVEGLRPLAPEAYPAQHQALSLLLTALAAVDVASPVLEVCVFLWVWVTDAQWLWGRPSQLAQNIHKHKPRTNRPRASPTSSSPPSSAWPSRHPPPAPAPPPPTAPPPAAATPPPAPRRRRPTGPAA